MWADTNLYFLETFKTKCMKCPVNVEFFKAFNVKHVT